MQTMTESDRSGERETTGGDAADIALARSQAQMAELAARHGANPAGGQTGGARA